MAPARKKRKVQKNGGSSVAKSNEKDPVEKVDSIEDKVATGNNSTESESQKFWLMKSEPETRMQNGVDVKFGIEDLKKELNQTACWDGVRNHQARNIMRDQMKVGDKAFFYHSNCKPPGVAGIVTIVKEGYPDHTQFDRADPHFDPKSSQEDPKWFMVDVKFDRMMKRYISLYELKDLYLKHKKSNGPLKTLALFTQSRLSVQPLTKDEFDYIVSLEEKEEKDK